MAKYIVIMNKISSSRNGSDKVESNQLNLQFEYEEYSAAYESYKDKIVEAAKHNGTICYTLIEETISLVDAEGRIDSSLTLSNNVKL